MNTSNNEEIYRWPSDINPDCQTDNIGSETALDDLPESPDSSQQSNYSNPFLHADNIEDIRRDGMRHVGEIK